MHRLHEDRLPSAVEEQLAMHIKSRAAQVWQSLAHLAIAFRGHPRARSVRLQGRPTCLPPRKGMVFAHGAAVTRGELFHLGAHHLPHRERRRHPLRVAGPSKCDNGQTVGQ